MKKDGHLIWKNERRKLSELKIWPRNPRRIDTKQAKRLVESIDEFGQVETLAIGPKGEIYNGHQRLKVLMAEQGPDYEVDVRIASRALTEKEREKLVIYLHKGAAGEWDFDILAKEFELEELLDWGFAEKELAGLDFGEQPPEDPGAQMDRAEELREKWGVELGQLWEVGRHRIICGDCTDRAVVERILDIQPGMMVTDPPYGVEYDPGWRNEAAEKGLISFAARREGKVENDERADWSDAWILFLGDVAYCWHANLHASTVELSFRQTGFEPPSHIVWAKDNFAISRGHYHWKHELCIYFVRKGKSANWIGGRAQTTLWEIGWDKNIDGGHGTQKPLECMERPIRNHRFDAIYDPFLGSGTTLVACERLGRIGRGIEISPAYVAVSLQRLADMGLEPKLMSQ